MPVSCVAYGCTNRYKPGQTIHFFRFPLANVNLNKKWIAAIKRKNFTPTKWSRLCSDHFVYENYQTSKVPRKEPFERNLIQIGDSNFNAAGEYDIPLGLVDDEIGTSDDIPLEDDEIGTSDNIPLEYDKVDEIVLTTNNKEVQTVNTYTSELLLKKKIRTLQQKLRRKDKKIYNLQELLSDLKS
ncbi:THAP domain-containing protein 1-like [Myzus persicae]|uniref:THAP domain-containing protein 1-like n=1 Tax=Myzus persicae TaxID=13164 RepID=UPI000B930AF0|nr:THAP domain-containing protein 1-like [Myzus persicae]